MPSLTDIARGELAAVTDQQGGLKAIRSNLLPDAIRRRLVAEGYILSISAGWYIHWSPEATIGNGPEWDEGLHDFIIAFGNSWFGSNWSASASLSLQLHTGARMPRLITLYATSKNKKTRELIDGSEIYIRVADSFQSLTQRPKVRGLPTYSLADALVFAPSEFLKENPDILKTALLMLQDVPALAERIRSINGFARAKFLGEQLIECGRPDAAQNLHFDVRGSGSNSVALKGIIGSSGDDNSGTPRAFRSETMQKAVRERLLNAGYLLEITSDWCLSWQPSAEIGNSEEWHEGIRDFLLAYGTATLTSDWLVSPDASLQLHVASRLPAQIVLHNQKQAWIRPLCGGGKITILKVPELPAREHRSSVLGLPVYSLESAIVRASTGFLQANPTALREALLKLQNVETLAECQRRYGKVPRLELLGRALAECGRDDLARRFRALCQPRITVVREEHSTPQPRTLSSTESIGSTPARLDDAHMLATSEPEQLQSPSPTLPSQLDGINVFSSQALPKRLRDRLIKEKKLLLITRGWLIRWDPSAVVGEGKRWRDSVRDFVTAYGNAWFGSTWCASADLSLLLYAGNELPREIHLHSSSPSRTCLLADGTVVKATPVKYLPSPALRSSVKLIPTYALEEALVYASTLFASRNQDVFTAGVLAVDEIASLGRRLRDANMLARVQLIDETLNACGRLDLSRKLRNSTVDIKALGLDNHTLADAATERGQLRSFQSSALPKSRRDKLTAKRYILGITQGWYIPWQPSAKIGSSTEWHEGLRDFVISFCDTKFPGSWCTSPNISLLLHAGKPLPRYVLINTRKKHIDRLLAGGFELNAAPISHYPTPSLLTVVNGMTAYTIEEALVRATVVFLESNPEVYKAALMAAENVDAIIKGLLKLKKHTRLQLLAKDFAECGRLDFAERLSHAGEASLKDERRPDAVRTPPKLYNTPTNHADAQPKRGEISRSRRTRARTTQLVGDEEIRNSLVAACSALHGADWCASPAISLLLHAGSELPHSIWVHALMRSQSDKVTHSRRLGHGYRVHCFPTKDLPDATLRVIVNGIPAYSLEDALIHTPTAFLKKYPEFLKKAINALFSSSSLVEKLLATGRLPRAAALAQSMLSCKRPDLARPVIQLLAARDYQVLSKHLHAAIPHPSIPPRRMVKSLKLVIRAERRRFSTGLSTVPVDEQPTETVLSASAKVATQLAAPRHAAPGMRTTLNIAQSHLAAVATENGGLKAVPSALLPRSVRRILAAKGYILSICDGWYIHWDPRATVGSSPEWTAGVRDFLIAYASFHLGPEWSASANLSLILHADQPLPRTIILHATSKNRWNRVLVDGTEIRIFVVKNLPPIMERTAIQGIPIYSVNDTLTHATTTFLESHPEALKATLLKLEDPSSLADKLVKNKSFARAKLLHKYFLEYGMIESSSAFRLENIKPQIRPSRTLRATRERIKTQLLAKQNVLAITPKWTIPWSSDAIIGSSKEWHDGLRSFVRGYCDRHLQSGWLLSPDISLQLHIGIELPKTVVVHSDAKNWRRSLVGGYWLSILKVPMLPSTEHRSEVNGLPVYSLESAIIRASTKLLESNPEILHVALSRLEEVSQLVECQSKFGKRPRIDLIESTLVRAGRQDLANHFINGIRGTSPHSCSKKLPRKQPLLPKASKDDRKPDARYILDADNNVDIKALSRTDSVQSLASEARADTKEQPLTVHSAVVTEAVEDALTPSASYILDSDIEGDDKALSHTGSIQSCASEAQADTREQPVTVRSAIVPKGRKAKEFKAGRTSELSVIRSDALPDYRLRELLRRENLLAISDDWYIPWHPKAVIGSSPEWDRGLRDFIIAFCDVNFGNRWCAAPSFSLLLHLNRGFPREIPIITDTTRTDRALVGGFHFSAHRIDRFPDASALTKVNGIVTYKLEEAIAQTSIDFMDSNRELLEVALITLQEMSSLAGCLAREKKWDHFRYLADCLQSYGHVELAKELSSKIGESEILLVRDSYNEHLEPKQPTSKSTIVVEENIHVAPALMDKPQIREHSSPTSESERLLERDSYNERSEPKQPAPKSAIVVEEKIHAPPALVDEPKIVQRPSLTALASGKIGDLWHELRTAVLQHWSLEPADSSNILWILESAASKSAEDGRLALALEGYKAGSAEATLNPMSSKAVLFALSGKRKTQSDAALQGYSRANLLVRKSLASALKDPTTLLLVSQDVAAWRAALYQPLVLHGESPFARGSASGNAMREWRHVDIDSPIFGPPSVPGTGIDEAMIQFFYLLETEKEASVRIVLGHFMFAYINPCIVGSGWLARFIMNLMLGSAGWPWTTIPAARKLQYEDALRAGAAGNIAPLTTLLAALVAAGRVREQ